MYGTDVEFILVVGAMGLVLMLVVEVIEAWTARRPPRG